MNLDIANLEAAACNKDLPQEVRNSATEQLLNIAGRSHDPRRWDALAVLQELEPKDSLSGLESLTPGNSERLVEEETTPTKAEIRLGWDYTIGPLDWAGRSDSYFREGFGMLKSVASLQPAKVRYVLVSYMQFVSGPQLKEEIEQFVRSIPDEGETL
jgi:hypothetical protein